MRFLKLHPRDASPHATQGSSRRTRRRYLLPLSFAHCSSRVDGALSGEIADPDCTDGILNHVYYCVVCDTIVLVVPRALASAYVTDFVAAPFSHRHASLAPCGRGARG